MKIKNRAFLKRYFGLFLAFILIVLGFLFLINISSAVFSIGERNYSISGIYGANSSVNGWMNLSFQNEPLDSVFSASFLDNSRTIKSSEISLKKILELNPDYPYSCVPEGCGKNYLAGEGAERKQFNLGENENATYGIKIVGNNFNEITKFSLDVSSDASSSSSPQLIIDVLDDNEVDWLPYAHSGNFGNENFGCYTEPKTESGIISETALRNQILLAQSPNLKIGAYVERLPNVQGVSNFIMTISDINGVKEGYCEVSNVANSERIECIPMDGNEFFRVREEEQFIVSIYTKDYESRGKYILNYKTNSECFEEESFKLFAKAGTYASLGSFNIDDNHIELSEITNYIQEKYNGDCTGEGCIVPIKFISKNSQQIILSNADVRYRRGGIEQRTTSIFSLTETSPRISSNYKRLNIGRAEFRTPESPLNYTFNLKLNNREIISERIEVKNLSIIKSLTPIKTASTVPTEFIAYIQSPESISVTNYYWDFGNGATKSTLTNKTTNTYQNIGDYLLTITLTNTLADNTKINTSQTFEIEVESPKEMIGSTLEKSKRDIENTKNYLQGKSLFQKKSLNETLNLEFLENKLDGLNQSYFVSLQDKNITNQTLEMNRIVTELLSMEIPRTIFKTKQAESFSFIPNTSFIDLEKIKLVGSGNYDVRKSDEYKNYIIFWQTENLNVIFNFNEFSADYESGATHLVNVFELKVTEKKNIPYNYYLFIPSLENINFDREIDERGGFYAINLKNTPQINFYTTEDVDVSEIPVFISPSLTQLNVTSPSVPPSYNKPEPKKIVFILSVVLLLILGVATYIIMRKWYKKKYEGYLFSNRKDLYNLMIYINNSKRKGMEYTEIEEHLKKAKWSSEQIKYAMKKHKKGTEILDMPIKKILREEIKNNNLKENKN